MLTLIIAAMLGQFKEGDTVYIPKGGEAYRTADDAVHRMNGVELSYHDGKVIAVKSVDGERLLRIDRPGYEVPVWVVEKNVREFDEQAKAEARKYFTENIEANREKLRQGFGQTEQRKIQAARTAALEKYKPFSVTKPEHEALTVVINKGLDPITMTAEQAKALSASQRRAISSIKARYVRANGKK